MFSITKLIVLFLIIYETTVCQSEFTLTRRRERFRRESPNENTNESDGIISDSNKQTTQGELDQIIPKIFTVRNVGLELFNNTDATNIPNFDPNDPQQKQQQLYNDKQDFKVQRNSDGKLNIVFNNVFSPQKSSSAQRSNVPNTERTPKPISGNDYPQKDFYFPDEIRIDSKPECQEKGKSFCTNVRNYPEDKVEAMLKKQISKFDVLFGDDDIVQPLNISQRMSPGEDSLCRSVERIIYPKAGESKDLKWLYIINQQNYTQAVKIEECVNPEGECMFSENFPNGYVTMCKQSFIYRQLVAITKTGEIVKDNFKLPSCCKCIYKQK